MSKTRFFDGVQKQSPNPTQTLTNNLNATFRGEMDLFWANPYVKFNSFKSSISFMKLTSSNSSFKIKKKPNY